MSAIGFAQGALHLAVLLGLLRGEQGGKFFRILRHADVLIAWMRLSRIGRGEGEQVEHALHRAAEIGVVLGRVEVAGDEAQRLAVGVLERLAVVDADGGLLVRRRPCRRSSSDGDFRVAAVGLVEVRSRPPSTRRAAA